MSKEAPPEAREWTVDLKDGSVFFAERNHEEIDVWLPGHVSLKDCSSFFPRLGIDPEKGKNWVFLGNTYGYQGEPQTHLAIPEEAAPALLEKTSLKD